MAEESGEGFAWQQAGKSLRAIHKRRLSRRGGGYLKRRLNDLVYDNVSWDVNFRLQESK